MEKNRRGGLLFSKIVNKCPVTSSGACGLHDPVGILVRIARHANHYACHRFHEHAGHVSSSERHIS